MEVMYIPWDHRVNVSHKKNPEINNPITGISSFFKCPALYPEDPPGIMAVSHGKASVLSQQYADSQGADFHQIQIINSGSPLLSSGEQNSVLEI